MLAKQKESVNGTMGLNSIATLAANMIGIGFSQMEQFTSVIDVPIMSSGTFKIKRRNWFILGGDGSGLHEVSSRRRGNGN